MENIILSGDRPTGKLHLGHYVGSLIKRVELNQNTTPNNPIKILIADTQVLNNDVSKAKYVRENTEHLMRAYLALGLDNSQFILQSSIPYIFELSNYLSNLATLSSIKRNPTIKAENALYNDQLNMGFLNYPIAQTADILIFGANKVPVGQDQVAILEYGNDLIDKFHHYFDCNIFKKIEPIITETPRLVGIDGENKMSKSLGNAIFLDDSFEEIQEKVKTMYTDSNHIKVSDPGKVEGNVVFMYLDVFHKDKQELESLKEHYKKGGLGDMALKRMLMKDIDEVIAPIREKYNSFSKQEIAQKLEAGTEKALEEAKLNMSKIKEFIFK